MAISIHLCALVLAFSFFTLLVTGLAADDNIDCSKIPIENIEPCKDFLSNRTAYNPPTAQCCNSAKTWLSYSPVDVCKCYKQDLNRLSFRSLPERAAGFRILCDLPPVFSKYSVCLILIP